MHQFKTEQWLPVTVDEAWRFFSSPKNLSVITPPELDFKIVTRLTDEDIYEGMLIDYVVKPLFGIPVRWRTGISRVLFHEYFADRQLKGPYTSWEHVHYFREEKGGVMMIDEVNYTLPFGVLGRILHKILIRKKIEYIFSFRRQILEKIFPEK
jgi:ligand-binding SRPBCC domain-containing protein